jgi:hypothetical protein
MLVVPNDSLPLNGKIVVHYRSLKMTAVDGSHS